MDDGWNAAGDALQVDIERDTQVDIERDTEVIDLHDDPNVDAATVRELLGSAELDERPIDRIVLARDQLEEIWNTSGVWAPGDLPPTLFGVTVEVVDDRRTPRQRQIDWHLNIRRRQLEAAGGRAPRRRQIICNNCRSTLAVVRPEIRCPCGAVYRTLEPDPPKIDF